MDPTPLMTQPATLAHAADGPPDIYNDPTTTYTPQAVRVWMHQTQRDEQTVRGQIESETWAVYLPPTITVGPADRLTVDGVTYELVGPPWRAFHPRLRRVTHIEATVRVTT